MRVLKTNISHITVEDFRKAKGVFVQNLRNLVEKIRSIQPDAGICLIGLYNPFYEYFSYIQEFDDVVAEWNQASRTVLMEYENTYFVEIAEMFKDSEEELLFTDHFHPNNKGYELMALAAFSELKKNDALAKGSGSHLTAQQRESGGENE